MIPFRGDMGRSGRLLRALVPSSRIASAQSQSLSVVAAGLHLVTPVAVVEVPRRGLREAVLETMARRPAELAADLRRVDRVSAIVAGPVGHEGLQLVIAAADE